MNPIVNLYNRMKAQFPDAVVLCRVGDFYETFCSDAVAIAHIIGCTLTQVSGTMTPNKKGTPLAGFPRHSLDLYLPKIVEAGLRIAIVEGDQPKEIIAKRGAE